MRFEICIKKIKSFIKEVLGLERAKFDRMEKELSTLIQTPLLEQHRDFFQTCQAPQATPLNKTVDWRVVQPEKTQDSLIQWFNKSATPAIKKLLLDDNYVDDVLAKLQELLTFAEKKAFVKVEPKLLEKPKDIKIEDVPISEATSIIQAEILSDEDFEIL